MKYEMEELVPIVAKLAEGFTSKESTSITYERAQQFMEAVLYCIHEGEMTGQFSLAKEDELSAEIFFCLPLLCCYPLSQALPLD